MWGHVFKKAMISPSKREGLRKPGFTMQHLRGIHFREVTEDSPDYDEYYEDETWEEFILLCQQDQEMCHLKKSITFYICYCGQICMNTCLNVIDIIQIYFLWLYTQSSFSFLKLRKLVLGRKHCATNRLCGICCFCDFPAPQEWRQLPIFTILVFILEYYSIG